MNAITTERLRKTFGGVAAVDDLSIVIQKGKIIGIIGPNGSGKTTLTNVLTGIHRMDGGVVVVGKKERTRIKSCEVFGLGLTRTFQNVRVFEQVSVLDNVLIAITKKGVLGSLFERASAAQIQNADAVLARVGLTEKRDALAAELSYGQRKLLEIARALATDAEIILFDEPYAGLFPEMVKRVSGIMQELKAEGKTVILIEHDMALIRELCDHVLVMDAGKLLAEGTPEAVLSNPSVIEAYLGV
ncbi:ATP-binding cassette domain-containing protein [Patescibacteria group bacterium]|nr:ATP-binding cassette domain-containing protein [Patescibacteria group bacterium]